MYLFKNKNAKEIDDKEEYKYDTNIGNDDNIRQTLQTGLGLEDFDNKKFNELFEKYNNKEKNDGYGEWLQKEEPILQQRQFSDENFEMLKQEMKSIIPYKGVETLHFNSQASYIDDLESGNNDSSLFDSLTYTDLKKAHTESLIPVSNEDFNQIRTFHSIDEYKRYRNNDELQFESKFNTELVFDDEEKTNSRAFNLAKQAEESNKRNKLFLKEFRLLK